MKKILIIVYRFPPMGGVGSRRWAKFAKYLAQRGYRVHVITCDYPTRDRVNWERDVTSEAIAVQRISTGYPSWLLQPAVGLRAKRNRLASWLLRHSLFYLDPTQRWGSRLLPCANRLIREEGISNVVVSGPPSSLHYAASFLKVENPGINLIQDYRDPWNSDRDYAYGTRLPWFGWKERSAYMELFTLVHASRVLVVSNDMRQRLLNLYSSLRPNVVTLHNGFDPDDYPAEPEAAGPTPFSLIYTGGLGSARGGRALALEFLARAIEASDDPFIKERLQVTIHSDLTAEHYRYSDCFPTIARNFSFHGLVPPAEVNRLTARHGCCLSLNAPDDAHAFGTKIFDYMAMGKAILHISNGGELAEVLTGSGQYVVPYDVTALVASLRRYKEDYLAGTIPGRSYPEFSLEQLTSRLEEQFVP